MYCPSCGKTMETGAKFCAICGAQAGSGYGTTGASVPPASAGMRTDRLLRPRFPRMIGGVCSAFALQYGWDISLVRVVAVVIALVTSGLGGLAYLAAWVIIPEAPYQLPMGTPGNPIV
jgi:phage shock protein C